MPGFFVVSQASWRVNNLSPLDAPPAPARAFQYSEPAPKPLAFTRFPNNNKHLFICSDSYPGWTRLDHRTSVNEFRGGDNNISSYDNFPLGLTETLSHEKSKERKKTKIFFPHLCSQTQSPNPPHPRLLFSLQSLALTFLNYISNPHTFSPIRFIVFSNLLCTDLVCPTGRLHSPSHVS